MRRILVLLLSGALLVGAGIGLRRLLVSDETRIRWLIEEAVEAFNDGRPRSTVEPLALDWYDRTTGVHRDTLFQVLVGMSFQERGAGSGARPWRLDVPRERLVIDVADDPADGARARFEAELSRRRGEESELEWRIGVEALLREGPDGWEIWSTSHETLEGRGPGR